WRGGRQGDHRPIVDAAIAWDGETIAAVGTTAEVRDALGADWTDHASDGRGYSLVPRFVEAHTHVVYAGDRQDELPQRLAGATYAEIAAAGGGILSTVAATRAASEDALVAATLPRLAEMLARGTTTCEAKSGYGLETEAELRLLRAMRRLN